MVTELSVKSWVDESIRTTDLYLVGIDISGSKIIVELDSNEGVQISDCVKVNRHIEQQLDLSGEDCSIEVTSSGIGKPFKILKQYLKHIGKYVEITEINGLKKTGLLINADQNKLKLEVKAKQGKQKGVNQKHSDNTILEIPMELIKETKATISFNKIKH
jgi:ribosome maturation factor RimP